MRVMLGGCARLAGWQRQGLALEEDLANSIWGYFWSERWLQCLISLAFTGVFMLVAIRAGAKIRYVK